MKKLLKVAGFSLVEVLVSMTIVTLCLLALLNVRYFIGRQSVNTKGKTFATQKILQMMEELRSLIVIADASSINVLDDFDDGTAYKTILTTNQDVTNPGDALSGNILAPNGWKYLRQITVRRLPNEPLARRVYIKVYLASASNPNQPEASLAETVSILKTIRSEFEPSQVMDVYVLALENVPGWWSAMSTIKPMFNSVIQDLQTRNPGLELRTHWITKLASAGRDRYYTPFINYANYADAAPINWVYYYPGLLDQSGSDFYYYTMNNMGAKINVDGAVVNAGSYAIADQYNHGVRYPEETGELTLRRFLEEINDPATSSQYQNCLVVDLHGELLPLPPMRNYSDAAKDPASYSQYRVVTHPEQLYYVSGSSVTLRVYSYVTDYPNSVNSFAHNLELSHATVFFPNDAISSADISIKKMDGDAVTNYEWINAVEGAAADYTVTTGTCTLIVLNDLPMRHALKINQGLDPGQRLYGLEYIPCPVTAGNNFSQDLATSLNNKPKNTARWRIAINPAVLSDGMHTFETRIWNGVAAVSGYPNISKNYVWVGTTPPITEQFQFMGDPRHMPYKDVKANHGYNWYFTNNTDNFGHYGGFSKVTTNGWDGTGGRLNIDIPRYFQMYRQGLLQTGGIWTNMTGFSFYYIGLGGEMGGDSCNGFGGGLPVHERPWNPGGGGTTGIDEITSADNTRIISRDNDTWYSRYWLGDLYPDNEQANWVANGNLSTGVGNYKRAHYSTFFGFNPVKRTKERGCASFINGAPTALTGPFNHEYRTGDMANLTAAGLALAQTFNFPLLDPARADRPATLNYGSRYPPEWNDAVYSGQRLTTSWISDYYDAPHGASYNSSGMVMGTSPAGETAFFTILGLSPQTNFGASQIARLCLVSMIRGFMDAGEPVPGPDLIVQLPRIEFTAPDPTDEFINPGTIDFDWNLEWRRWDGEPYTENYLATYTSAAAVSYVFKYSDDNGINWYFADDNTATTAGERNLAHAVSRPYTWNVAGFARGTYLVRVEVYRDNNSLHYSYHQMQFYLDNP